MIIAYIGLWVDNYMMGTKPSTATYQTNPATKLTNAESGQSWEEVGAPWELFHRIGPAWLDHRETQSARPTYTSQLLHDNQQVTKWSNLQAKQSSLHIPTYYCWGPMHSDFGNLVDKMSTNQTACKESKRTRESTVKSIRRTREKIVRGSRTRVWARDLPGSGRVRFRPQTLVIS